MRRLPLLVLAGLAAATVAACGGNPPPAQPGPQANADSIAAAERARQDSIARAEADARAREEAERVARQRAADSLAAMGRTTEAVRTMLAAMIHFDFDKSNIRSGDAGTLDQKVGILQANPNLRIRISGHCDERGSDEYNLALGNRRATAAQQAYLVQFRGDVRTDLVGVQQQLVTVQELTGQSQQRLSELRARIEERAQQPVPALDTSAARAPVGPSGNPVGPGPAQMYDLSLQQYRRGSLGTARLGFREFLRVYPGDERAADAVFYIGETFAAESPDSAAAVYEQVVKSHPHSSRAPAALYKLGLVAEARGDKKAARTYYARVVAGYPRSDEANLARDKLQRLGR